MSPEAAIADILSKVDSDYLLVLVHVYFTPRINHITYLNFKSGPSRPTQQLVVIVVGMPNWILYMYLCLYLSRLQTSCSMLIVHFE